MYVCSKPNCDNPHRSNGFCHNHYYNEQYKQRGINECTKPDCTRKIKARGLCKKHYDKMRTT